MKRWGTWIEFGKRGGVSRLVRHAQTGYRRRKEQEEQVRERPVS